ncbi:MAG TPA: BON domain-containing protein [Pyrinomonadaceae bacterium]|nr:BON domain-containing protein [Pyrinomonadaceae bacterium]
MNRKKLATLALCAALASLANACDGGDRANTNTNANTNANNTAVVTNNANTSASANANANTNANANSRANYNTNMTEEEFGRERARYERDAREAGSKIGTGAQDLWLWTKVRAALLAADDLRDSSINVDVDNGKVTLSGTVASGQQQVKAVSVARGVEGVKPPIENKLQVRRDGDGGGANTGNNANTKK